MLLIRNVVIRSDIGAFPTRNVTLNHDNLPSSSKHIVLLSRSVALRYESFVFVTII